MADRLLTPLQRRAITQAIRDGHLAYAAEMFGPMTIDHDDFMRLRTSGKIRDEKLMPQDIALAVHATLDTAKAISPDDFWRGLRDNPQVITEAEREAISILRDRMGQHVRGLGNKLDTITGQILVDVDDALRRHRLTKLQREIAHGIEARSAAQEVSARLRDSMKELKRDWMRVAYTEMHNAKEEAKAIVLAHNSPDRDPRVFKRPRPDACFPPGVLVTTSRGDVPIEDVAVGDMVLTHKLRWRRVKHHHVTPYNDDLVVLDVGTTRVPMTRNHPVLSGMNWQDAETLKQGDDVIRLLRTSHPDDEPTMLAQEGVPVAVEFPIVPAAASIDLHRQLLVRDGQIDVEFVDCVFRHETVRAQAFMQLLGVLGHHRTRVLLGSRLVPESLGLMREASSGTRTFRDLLTFLVGHLAIAQRERLTECAELHPGLHEPASDSTAAHAVFGGQSIGVFATLVGADDFLDRKIEFDRHQATVYASTQKINAVGLRRYDGVVHNLAIEDDESFFAGGLAVHNCRFCVMLYLRPDKVTPRVFKLSELLANGTNVGRKAGQPSRSGKIRTQWKAVIGAMHPFCSCELHVLPEGMGFNPSGQMTYVGLTKSVPVEMLDKALALHDCEEP